MSARGNSASVTLRQVRSARRSQDHVPSGLRLGAQSQPFPEGFRRGDTRRGRGGASLQSPSALILGPAQEAPHSCEDLWVPSEGEGPLGEPPPPQVHSSPGGADGGIR